MTINAWVQVALYCLLLCLLVKPFGGYMTRVFAGERTLLSPVLRPVERGLYTLCGVREAEEQHWVTYVVAMLLFSVAGFLSLYALQRLQGVLPFNPQGQSAVSADLAFNTSVSFVTNTNWQSYTPESTMSYLVQMAGLTVHNFLSAATGIALAIALIRGFARRTMATVGNFWVDMTRCTLYVLLPLSIVVALFFVWQGVPQNLHAYTEATTLEGAKQVIAQGPVASQEAIKMFGTNGGGFFNANSAHPFENPTALTNLVQMLLIFSIGAALTNVFGRMVGSQRQGWAIFAVMGILFLAGVFVTCPVESGATRPSPPCTSTARRARCRPAATWRARRCASASPTPRCSPPITTDTSCGAVNTMHDSLLPLAGMIPMVNIMLGEIIFGGVGSGLYGMLAFAIIAVFVAGLMVGAPRSTSARRSRPRRSRCPCWPSWSCRCRSSGSPRWRSCSRSARPRCQRRPARLQRGAVRLHLGHRQQRQRVRGAQRQRAVLERHARHRDAGRPLPVRHPGAGGRGLARGQEDRAGLGGHLPDRWRPVRGPGDRRHPHRGRPDLLSGARAGARRRALGHACRQPASDHRSEEQAHGIHQPSAAPWPP